MSQFQELTEDQWILIQELMSWSPPKERGKPRTNLKRVWNAILYILTHGCRWEDLPKQDMHTELRLIDGLCFGSKQECLIEC